jgi:hypothetical protein
MANDPRQFSLEAQIIEAPRATREAVYARQDQSAHVGAMAMAASERNNSISELTVDIEKLSAGCRAHENLRDEYEVANINQGAHGSMLRERRYHRVGSEKFLDSVSLYNDKVQAVLDLFMAGKKNFAMANGIDVIVEKRPIDAKDPNSKRLYTHVEAADVNIEKEVLGPNYKGFRKDYDPSDTEKAETSFVRQRILESRIADKKAEIDKLQGKSA